MRRALVSVLCLLAALATLPAGPAAGQPAAPTNDAAGGDNPARNYFTDVVLLNQHGEEMRLYSDLIAGKVVVVNAFFTSCTGACPMMAKSFARMQDHLGDRLGREVVLVSVSVDPETDTLPKVKEYAARFGARDGWYFLTGPPENVERALSKLGAYVEQPEAHTNLVIIGNEPTGLWKKAFGLAPAEELIEVMESVVKDEG